MIAAHWHVRVEEFSESIRRVEQMLCDGDFPNAIDIGNRTGMEMSKFAAMFPKEIQHKMKIHAVRLLYRVGNYRSGVDILSRCHGDDEVVRLMQLGETQLKSRPNAYDAATKLLDGKKWRACLDFLAQRDFDISWVQVCRMRAECCRQLGGDLGRFADDFEKEAAKHDKKPTVRYEDCPEYYESDYDRDYSPDSL